MDSGQPPILREFGHAPSGVCSRWMGSSPCGAAATHHVIWSLEMDNGLVCARHVAEAEAWDHVGLHPYGPACSAVGVASYYPVTDECVMPSVLRCGGALATCAADRYSLMSDRSKAWYEDPGNAEHRKVRMRLYGRAITALGREFPGERRSEYRKAVRSGLSPSAAQNVASKALREAHPERFREIYDALLAEDQSQPASGIG